MLDLLLGTTLFLALIAGIFIPLEGWFPRTHSAIAPRAALLCVALLFLDVLVMEALGGPILDALADLRPALTDPSAWRIALVLLLAEVCGYWAHRLMHGVPRLWRYHAVHHAPTHLTWLEAWRQHPLDFLIHGLIVGLPGALLGASLADIGAVVLLRKVYTTFLHANLRWRLTWLEPWIATPAYHARHHSHDPRDYQRNFAGMLPLLDRLFRTHAPAHSPGPTSP